jgi:D-alanyl-D-alanine carboxypeptidase/D-alanyl-D-alanine-endopeptidase (penicillin-binding protein 4)
MKLTVDKRLLLLFVFSAIAIAASCQSTPPLKLSGAETQSALVVDTSGGDTIFSFNARARMTPASITKLFTTAAALKYLGSGFRFSTRFYFNSEQKRLTVVGGGDPSTESAFFPLQTIESIAASISEKLKQGSVAEIKTISADLSIFGKSRPPSSRLWEDMGNYFGALPSPLSVGDNIFKLYLNSPSKPGSLCSIVKMDPPWGKMPECEVISRSQPGDSAYIYGTAGCNNWYVSGAIPTGKTNFTIKGALPEPHLWYCQRLSDELSKRGIKTGTTEVKELAPMQQNVLVHTHYSPSLARLCAVTNKNSNNLYADHLLFALGSNQNKSHWDGGTGMLQKFCRDSLSVFSASFHDGSGLSPFNSFAASDVVKLLRFMKNEPSFFESFSIGGIDGTSRNMWRDTNSKGRVRAKSGSMNGVMGYAGYISLHDGRLLAFCIMVNHHTEKNSTIRSAIEQWITSLISAETR